MNSDFFKSLGVDERSGPDELKKAYRKKAMEHHPDKGGDVEKFKEIHHAYKMLTDPSYRHKIEEHDKPVEIPVYISLEQAVFGVIINQNLTRNFQAVSGADDAIANCESTVYFFKHKISGWDGNPIVFNEEVDIGVKKKVKFIYVTSEHDRYKPDRRGLLVNEEIDTITALKGGEIQVQTLYGHRSLWIKPGTSIGTEYVVKNHGHLGDLIVRISGFKMPGITELKNDEKYKEFEIDWQKNEEIERKEIDDFNKVFMRFGGLNGNITLS